MSTLVNVTDLRKSFGKKKALDGISFTMAEGRVLGILGPNGSGKTTLKSIEKAIQVSDLGINPQNDGRLIRLTFPQLTEDRRREIVKGIFKTGEEAKIAIRSIRREAIEKFKALEKKSEITEDDLRNYEKDTQELTDKFCKKIDTLATNKEKDILEI